MKKMSEDMLPLIEAGASMAIGGLTVTVILLIGGLL